MDIFSLVLGEITSVRQKFCSPLREDRKPGCGLYHNGNEWKFYDFARGESYSAMELYRRYTGIEDEYERLCQMSRELQTSTHAAPSDRLHVTVKRNEAMKESKGEARVVHEFTTIESDAREFLPEELAYWKKYGISKERLDHDGVKAVSRYRIKAMGQHDFYGWKYTDPYCFSLPITHPQDDMYQRVKLYMPFADRRFITNCTADDIGEAGCAGEDVRVCIITKSYKDAAVLADVGYKALWLQNEGMIPTDRTRLHALCTGLPSVIFFDNDKAGKLAADKMFNELHIPTIALPDSCPYKDPSDLVAYSIEGKKYLGIWLCNEMIELKYINLLDERCSRR